MSKGLFFSSLKFKIVCPLDILRALILSILRQVDKKISEPLTCLLKKIITYSLNFDKVNFLRPQYVQIRA